MKDTGFSQKQLEQLKQAVRGEVRDELVDQMQEFKESVRGEIHDEFITQLQHFKQTVRGEVRDEVASQLDAKLKPLHEEIQEFRAEAREDADALNSVLMEHDREIKKIKRHLQLPVASH